MVMLPHCLKNQYITNYYHTLRVQLYRYTVVETAAGLASFRVTCWGAFGDIKGG